MRIAVPNAVFILAFLVSCSGWAQSNPPQSQAAFERAINDSSTSPYYVLITVKDSTTNQSTTYCTLANFLLGAIHREYDLGFDTEGGKQAQKIAIENSDHVFSFGRTEALKNVHVRYSPTDLESARISLTERGLSNTIDSIFSYGYRDAVACLLIEQGYSPWVADRSGKLKLERKPAYHPRSSCESSGCP